jgi:hypothetical protein
MSQSLWSNRLGVSEETAARLPRIGTVWKYSDNLCTIRSYGGYKVVWIKLDWYEGAGRYYLPNQICWESWGSWRRWGKWNQFTPVSPVEIARLKCAGVDFRKISKEELQHERDR